MADGFFLYYIVFALQISIPVQFDMVPLGPARTRHLRLCTMQGVVHCMEAVVQINRPSDNEHYLQRGTLDFRGTSTQKGISGLAFYKAQH